MGESDHLSRVTQRAHAQARRRFGWSTDDSPNPALQMIVRRERPGFDLHELGGIPWGGDPLATLVHLVPNPLGVSLTIAGLATEGRTWAGFTLSVESWYVNDMSDDELREVSPSVHPRRETGRSTVGMLSDGLTMGVMERRRTREVSVYDFLAPQLRATRVYRILRKLCVDYQVVLDTLSEQSE